MSTDDKNERLSILNKIPREARIDRRLLLDENEKDKKNSNLPRNRRRLLEKGTRKLVKEYQRIIRKHNSSGAGYPIDQFLRSMAIEYTQRYANSGVYTQPLSFNYIEPFCEIKLFQDTVAPFVDLLQEVNHLFNVTDFFDYITSNDAQSFDLTSLRDLPENKTFHFTTNGDVMDFSYLNSDGKEFVISGFSMVRRKDSLYWYLLGGEVLSDVEWKMRSGELQEMELSNRDPFKIALLGQLTEIYGNKHGAPIPLEGTDFVAKTIIAGETDLATKKYLGRCIMSETENSFSNICDDPNIYRGMTEDEIMERVEQMTKLIDHHAVMWNLVGAMFQLPAYFAYKIQIDKQLVEKAGKTVKSMKKSGGKGIRADYEIITAIEVSKENIPMVRSFLPIHYDVETEGHWRRLPNDAIGKGPDEKEVKGQTWVKARERIKRPEKPNPKIYVKSLVKAAKRKKVEYEKAARAAEERETTTAKKKLSDHGQLYVLRCTTMKEQHYKVGWTSGDAQSRAIQLSSDTGVPESFVVVEAWTHKNADALEKSVHAMLDPYRVNDRREFFHAPYAVIKKIIEAEISRSLN